MLKGSVWRSIRGQIKSFSDRRSELISLSREILQISKNAIYSIHRGHDEKASDMLRDARVLVRKGQKLKKKDPNLVLVGAWNEGMEEYVEALVFLAFVRGKDWPDPSSIGVAEEVFLQGVCDMCGELVRYAVNGLIAGKEKRLEEALSVCRKVYSELLKCNFRNSLLRKKSDSVKYHVQKLEDLALKKVL